MQHTAFHECSTCKSRTSSYWHRDSNGDYLCNFCSSHDRILTTANTDCAKPTCTKKKVRKKKDRVCYNCKSRDTPLWRKYGNQHACNACGLYHKIHGTDRPFSPTPKPQFSSLKKRKVDKILDDQDLTDIGSISSILDPTALSRDFLEYQDRKSLKQLGADQSLLAPLLQLTNGFNKE